MIEKVYNNEDKDDDQVTRLPASFKMPKNIRQVGKSSSDKKIYVEDYVMTFIRQLAGDDYSKSKIAVLVGQYIKTEGIRHIFVSGAIELEEMDLGIGDTFTNEIWTSIYEQVKKYFVEYEIVGWFLGGPGYLLEDHEKIRKLHVDNFAGQDKALMTYDNMEKEEAFWFYEDNKLAKQGGYYIYYDKNEDMQTYMIEHNRYESEESKHDDHVSKEIRAVIDNMKPQKKEKIGPPRLIYAGGTLLAVVILIAAAAMLDNYDQMKTMQDTLDSLASNIQGVESVFTNDKDKEKNQLNYVDSPLQEGALESKDPWELDEPLESKVVGEDSLDVNILPGNVTPVEETPSNNKEEKKPDEKPDDKADKKPDKKPDNKSDAEETTAPKETNYYVVSAGDTLAGISYKLYDSPNYMSEIMRLNNMDDENYIFIGQKLIVP